jgi:hypothetical protein
VLAAAEEKRLPDARAEMLAAIAAGDYLEDVEGGNEVQTAAPVIMPAESQMAHTQYRIREDPRIVLAFRPDRTGQFVAPAAWVTHATDGSPLSVAAPFAFQVLEADAALPSRPSELRVREELRARVTAALQLAPDSYLSARLSQTTTSLDLRDLAFVGLFNTQDAKAADAYAALCAAAGTAASLDALREAQEWRERLTLSADATPTPLLLKRALESDDLAGALARALDALELPTERPAAERAETISTALSEVLLILAYEDTWRRQTCAALRRNPALEYVRPRMLWRGDVLRRMKPAAADAMLNTLDELANVPRRATRGPTLHEALKSWAEYEGLSLAIADGVPNLEAEEFTLALPEVPSVRDLDESLRGLYLRARRKGLEVSVYADVIEPALRPEARELLAAKDAEGRLRAFLNAHKTDGNGLLTLAAKRESAESGYTPRVEAPGELPASEFLPKLALSAEHSIWEQRAALRAQGLRLETADGVLRLVLVK